MSRQHIATAGPATILIVDDDTPVLDSLRLLLELEGYRVVTARDGREGLANYHSVAPDLVITDMMLPQEPGLAVIAGIKQANPAANIIAISGGVRRLLEAHSLEAAKELGASIILRKPYDPDEMLVAVSSLLSQAPV
jgi:DNA-binding response OmpR family regulator